MEVKGANPFLFTEDDYVSPNSGNSNPFLMGDDEDFMGGGGNDNPFLSQSAATMAPAPAQATNPFAFDPMDLEPSEAQPAAFPDGNAFLIDANVTIVPQKPTDLDLKYTHTVATDFEAAGPKRPPPPRPPPSKETQDLLMSVMGEMDAASTHLLDRIPPTRTPSPVSMRDLHSPSPTPEPQFGDLLDVSDAKTDTSVSGRQQKGDRAEDLFMLDDEPSCDINKNPPVMEDLMQQQQQQQQPAMVPQQPVLQQHQQAPMIPPQPVMQQQPPMIPPQPVQPPQVVQQPPRPAPPVRPPPPQKPQKPPPPNFAQPPPKPPPPALPQKPAPKPAEDEFMDMFGGTQQPAPKTTADIMNLYNAKQEPTLDLLSDSLDAPMPSSETSISESNSRKSSAPSTDNTITAAQPSPDNFLSPQQDMQMDTSDSQSKESGSSVTFNPFAAVEETSPTNPIAVPTQDFGGSLDNGVFHEDEIPEDPQPANQTISSIFGITDAQTAFTSADSFEPITTDATYANKNIFTTADTAYNQNVFTTADAAMNQNVYTESANEPANQNVFTSANVFTSGDIFAAPTTNVFATAQDTYSSGTVTTSSNVFGTTTTNSNIFDSTQDAFGATTDNINAFGATTITDNTNAFGATLPDNTFGSALPDNTFGSALSDNTFGSALPDNTFGSALPDNTFGSALSDNTFGSALPDNTFGSALPDSTFGSALPDNAFGSTLPDNTFGSALPDNTNAFGAANLPGNTNAFASITTDNAFGANDAFGSTGNSNAFGSSANDANLFGGQPDDDFDAFAAKFDSVKDEKNGNFDAFGGGGGGGAVVADTWGDDGGGFNDAGGFGGEETFDAFLAMKEPPAVPQSTPSRLIQAGSIDSDEEKDFSVVIRPKTDDGGFGGALPVLAPPPAVTSAAFSDSSRINPFDQSELAAAPAAVQQEFTLPMGGEMKRTDSQETPPTPLFDDDVSQPLEPFPRVDFLGDGWEMHLRQPNKKKITGQRFWKKIFVRLVYQQDCVLLQLYNQATDKDPFQELPLQPCYSVSDIGAQQYDNFGKIFTVKLQYIFYKERPGVRLGQVKKAERITNKLSQFAAYAIQGDYQGCKEFGSDLKKLGLPVEHAPQVSQLMKLGSLSFEDLKQFSVTIEEALFKLQAHRDRALHYKMEEVQVTAVDELYVEQDAEGHIEKQIARVRLFFLGFLTGMPDIELGVNDMRRQGKEVVGRHDIIPVVTEEWIRLENVEFHNCVQQVEYNDTHIIKFKPPDACYIELLRFRVRPPKNRELPLQLKAQICVTGTKVELRADVLVPGFASRKLGQVPCEDVMIRFPIPECWIYMFRVEKHFRYGSVKSAHRRTGKIKGIERILGTVDTLQESLIEVTSGQAKYEHQHRAIVWRCPRLPKEGQGAYTTHNMVCRLSLTSYDQIPDQLAEYAFVEFTMPATQVSHTTVRSVSLQNSDSDEPPEKYVRYLARHEYRVGIEHTEGEGPSAYAVATQVKAKPPPPEEKPAPIPEAESSSDSD